MIIYEEISDELGEEELSGHLVTVEEELARIERVRETLADARKINIMTEFKWKSMREAILEKLAHPDRDVSYQVINLTRR